MALKRCPKGTSEIELSAEAFRQVSPAPGTGSALRAVGERQASANGRANSRKNERNFGGE